MPLKICLEPGCGTPAHRRGSCRAHSAQYERSINRAGRKVYDSRRWRILRRHKLSLNPICERCNEVLAEHVHHKHGVVEDPWSIDVA